MPELLKITTTKATSFQSRTNQARNTILSHFILTIAPAAITTALYFIVFGTLIGRRAGGALRGMIVGLTAAIVTMVFTRTFLEHAFPTSAILLLVSVVSALAGFSNGIFATTLEQVNSVATFVLTPLTYLDGIFYSVSLLPFWAQKLSRMDPLFYLVGLFRYCMIGAFPP
jgi:ABC-type multidrug transport system permease subunit